MPVSFGNDSEAREALQSQAVVADQSHFGRFRVTGRDSLKFLQAQSTNDFSILQPGQGCRTVVPFSTPICRLLCVGQLCNSLQVLDHPQA